MSNFSMFVPTKSDVKLANRKTGNNQGIDNIFCSFFICPIIYPMGTVCYCPVHSSNAISLSALKCFFGSQKFTSEPPEHFDFVDPEGLSWKSPYQPRKNLDYLQI